MAVSPDPRRRVAVDPAGLFRVADRFDADADRLAAAAANLTRAATGVRLNGADPALLPARLHGRRRDLVGRLTGVAADHRTDGALCRSTAAAALRADTPVSGNGAGSRRADASVSGNAAGGGPVCRLPERYRTPVDRVLTEWIGRAVEGTVRAAIEVFDRAGAATPDRHEGTEGGGNGRGDDPGGTFTARPVSITHLDEPNLVSAALTMVGDQGLLANDEFGLIDHGGNRFTVVLPGVTDLTVPEPGWNPVHRTVRDLDRVAIDSARVNGIGYNRYARMVAEGLAINGVDEGAELLLIRHSFGADTALDLAADPAFTERYRLVQVVATGYNSEPQLAPVAPGVEVLVVRNRHDLVVAAETLLPSDQTGVLGCDQPPGRANGSVTAGIGAATIITFDGGWVGPSPGPGPDLEPGSGPRLVGDLGHGIARYRRVFTDHAGLSAAGAASIGAVVADLEARGFVSNRSAAPPIVTAIDVSVPHP